ncbi:MAG: TIGR03943 family protein [Chloroflexota bacterium]|nr:TIGR03943 family protein [Chloroflexota bacterium]
MTHVVRGLLLLALASLIAKLLVSGQMAMYMSPALNPLTGGTGVVIAGMGVYELWLGGRTRAAVGTGAHGSLADQALTYLLVLVPVGLGLVTVPRALDSTALGGQDVSRVVIAFSPIPVASSVGPPAQPIEDVAGLFKYLRTAGEGGVGQPVHLVGMVARGDSLSSDQFVLLRYAIVHCVADAQPIGLLVRMPPAAADLTTNGWVEIDGTLESTEKGGAHLIGVLANRVAPADEPPEPYLQSL